MWQITSDACCIDLKFFKNSEIRNFSIILCHSVQLKSILINCFIEIKDIYYFLMSIQFSRYEQFRTMKLNESHLILKKLKDRIKMIWDSFEFFFIEIKWIYFMQHDVSKNFTADLAFWIRFEEQLYFWKFRFLKQEI